MRLVLGIDEAGYGPRIGPLVVGASLLRVPSQIRAVGPDLWDVFVGKVLRPIEPLDPEDPAYESPEAIFIGDSKLICRELWVDELERSALSLLGWGRGGRVATSEQALAIAGRFDREVPWFAADHDVFPLAPQACARTVDLGGRAVAPVWMGTRVLSTRQYNAACAQTENKAVVNWALVAMLIEEALERADGVPVEIIVDRQGGRVHYEDLLRQLFGADVRVVEKQPRRSAYEVDDDRVRSIEFRVDGDVDCMAVSVASILAKYTRELLMARLNRFFAGHQPALEPTTGYFSDGNRFIRETADARGALGIDDGDFVRDR